MGQQKKTVLKNKILHQMNYLKKKMILVIKKKKNKKKMEKTKNK